MAKCGNFRNIFILAICWFLHTLPTLIGLRLMFSGRFQCRKHLDSLHSSYTLLSLSAAGNVLGLAVARLFGAGFGMK